MVLFLILLRLVASPFISPPSPPSDDGESELPPPSPQHQRPVAVVQPLPPPSPPSPPSQLPLFANQHQLYNNHEDIVWPGAADHPDRQTCQLAGSVGHYRCSLRRPCRRPHPSTRVEITPQVTLPHSTTNRHSQGDVILSWEEDFDWTAGAAATAAPYQQRQQQQNHEWSQDDWEENVGASAAADNLYNYMEARNAAAGHKDGYAHRWDGADWNAAEDDEWERQGLDLPLLHPDQGEREGWPVSAHSSLPLLESVQPTPSSSPPPLQLQYIPEGDAGPTYALQVGPSLHLQPVQQHAALLHQLRNVLILEGEEEDILSRRTSPAAAALPPATAVAATQFTGRRCCRHRSAPTVLGFAARRRCSSV
jgi:hypothetical protein